jgi:hypothetical protein
MASARKNLNPKKPSNDKKVLYADAIKQILTGQVTATRLVETTLPNGKLKLEYDDPNG